MKSVFGTSIRQWDVQKYNLYFTFRSALYICTKPSYSKVLSESYLTFDENGVSIRQKYRHFYKISKTGGISDQRGLV